MYDQGQISTSLYYTDDSNGVSLTKPRRGGEPQYMRRIREYDRNSVLQIDRISHSHVPQTKLQLHDAFPLSLDPSRYIEEPFRFEELKFRDFTHSQRLRRMKPQQWTGTDDPTTMLDDQNISHTAQSELIRFKDAFRDRAKVVIPLPNEQKPYDRTVYLALGYLASYHPDHAVNHDFARMVQTQQPIPILIARIQLLWRQCMESEVAEFGGALGEMNLNFPVRLMAGRDVFNSMPRPGLDAAAPNAPGNIDAQQAVMRAILNAFKEAEGQIALSRTNAYFTLKLLPPLSPMVFGPMLGEIQRFKAVLETVIARPRPGDAGDRMDVENPEVQAVNAAVQQAQRLRDELQYQLHLDDPDVGKKSVLNPMTLEDHQAYLGSLPENADRGTRQLFLKAYDEITDAGNVETFDARVRDAPVSERSIMAYETWLKWGHVMIEDICKQTRDQISRAVAAIVLFHYKDVHDLEYRVWQMPALWGHARQLIAEIEDRRKEAMALDREALTFVDVMSEVLIFNQRRAALEDVETRTARVMDPNTGIPFVRVQELIDGLYDIFKFGLKRGSLSQDQIRFHNYLRAEEKKEINQDYDNIVRHYFNGEVDLRALPKAKPEVNIPQEQQQSFAVRPGLALNRLRQFMEEAFSVNTCEAMQSIEPIPTDSKMGDEHQVPMDAMPVDEPEVPMDVVKDGGVDPDAMPVDRAKRPLTANVGEVISRAKRVKDEIKEEPMDEDKSVDNLNKALESLKTKVSNFGQKPYKTRQAFEVRRKQLLKELDLLEKEAETKGIMNASVKQLLQSMTGRVKTRKVKLKKPKVPKTAKV